MTKALSAAELEAARELDARAKVHMQRGIALLAENKPEGLREAVKCFDEAIAMRRQLPFAANAWFRYGFIAGWLNRGDALTRLGSANDLQEALRSYDEALAQLRELPMAESPLFIRRLAIAWMNRGVTCLAGGSPANLFQASSSFLEAIAAAQHFSTKNPEEGRILLAQAWMNRANALIRLDPPQAEAARSAAKKALKFAAVTEKDDVTAAALGFSARHILCQSLAHLLSTDATSDRDALMHEASETVDEGMALARIWESRDAQQFRSQSAELFQFGCRVYQAHQPHFLTEFLLENLDPTKSDGSFAGDLRMHASAADALWRALLDLHRDGFKNINTPCFNEMLDQLRELRLTEEHLTKLREAHASKES